MWWRDRWTSTAASEWVWARDAWQVDAAMIAIYRAALEGRSKLRARLRSEHWRSAQQIGETQEMKQTRITRTHRVAGWLQNHSTTLWRIITKRPRHVGRKWEPMLFDRWRTPEYTLFLLSSLNLFEQNATQFFFKKSICFDLFRSITVWTLPNLSLIATGIESSFYKYEYRCGTESSSKYFSMIKAMQFRIGQYSTISSEIATIKRLFVLFRISDSVYFQSIHCWILVQITVYRTH